MRKFRQVKKEEQEGDGVISNDYMKNKIEKYMNVEKMIQDYDKKIVGEIEQPVINQHKREKKKEENKTNNIIHKDISPQNKTNYLNKKRERKSSEEIQKEKEIKLKKRQSMYKKLNKKTPKGQPVMKYKVEHIFNKIKHKINKGLI